ncbi:MAG: NUDIX hydrolase [Pseudomonadota bacterium]
MTIRQPHQRPLRLPDEGKRAVRTQFGALCWRKRADKVEVLLITSRQSKRWIIPKGWPVDGATPAEAAQTEAWEEAGVAGKVVPTCLGIYSYNKTIDGAGALPCVVAMFPIRVKKLSTSYPEQAQRRRKWFSRKKAAKLVDEPELANMILRFDPRVL